MLKIKLSSTLFALLMMFTVSVIMLSCEIEELPTSDCVDENLIKLEKGCEKNYKPVCGCDDNTYTNKCYAERAGVLIWEKGKCSTKLRFTEDKRYTFYSDGGGFPTLDEVLQENPNFLGNDWEYDGETVVK